MLYAAVPVIIPAMIGSQFGALVVAWRDWPSMQSVRYRPSWLCLCDCGRIVAVAESALVRREREDCGCCTAYNDRLRDR